MVIDVDELKSVQPRTGGILLVIGGIMYAIAGLTILGVLFVMPIGMILVIAGNVVAMRQFKKADLKKAATGCLLLLLSEALWIAFPIIVIVPIGVMMLAMQRYTNDPVKPRKVTSVILGILATLFTVVFVLAFLSSFTEVGFGVLSGAGDLDAIRATWPLYFVGRNVLPGILFVMPWASNADALSAGNRGTSSPGNAPGDE